MSKLQQVFIGCPFRRPIRRNYDRLKLEIEQETPLHVVLADTTSISSTDYLLEHITNLIRESSGCIFDATDGNPNVSLEVGIAHALPADFILALYTRRPRTSEERAVDEVLMSEGEVKPIISDLQGRNRIEYKTFPSLKDQLLKRYLSRLPYMGRWTDFKKRHATLVKHALAIFREVRLSGRTLRPRVEAMLDGSGLEVSDLFDPLIHARLLTVKQGRGGGIFYPLK